MKKEPNQKISLYLKPLNLAAIHLIVLAMIAWLVWLLLDLTNSIRIISTLASALILIILFIILVKKPQLVLEKDGITFYNPLPKKILWKEISSISITSKKFYFSSGISGWHKFLYIGLKRPANEDKKFFLVYLAILEKTSSELLKILKKYPVFITPEPKE